MAAAAPAGADEPVPARSRAAHHARRLDLRSRPTVDRFDVVLTNPPFGTKGANQAPDRDDFTVVDLQQAAQLPSARPDDPEARRPRCGRPAGQLPLRRPGRRGVQDPDARTATCTPSCGCRAARSRPTARASRPTSSSSPRASPTETVWIYDARTNVPGITKKDRPLTPSTSPSSRSATAPTRTAGPSASRATRGRPLADVSRSARSRSATSSSTASSG